MTAVPPTPAESEPIPADSEAARPTATSSGDAAPEPGAETVSGTGASTTSAGKPSGTQREPAPAEPPLRRNLVILAAMALTVIAALVAAGMMVG
ncbi:hypothetical protein ACWIGI_21150 [Nocardia sp. NPDC055321]